MLRPVPHLLTNPVWFLSILSVMYFFILASNLDSSHLITGDTTTIGLNWSPFGISGQTLFRGISLALKEMSPKAVMVSLFHHPLRRLKLSVSLNQVSVNPSKEMAFLFDSKDWYSTSSELEGSVSFGKDLD